MIHVVVDVDLPDHPKTLDAGMESLGLWLWGTCYSRRYLTDGRIPGKAARMAMGSPDAAARAIQELVRTGLWIVDGDDFLVAKYAEKGNQTKLQVQAATRLSKARKAKYNGRARNGDGTPFRQRSNTVPPDTPGARSDRDCGSSSSSSISESGSDLDPEGVQGEERANSARVRAAPATREFTDPPADIEITSAVLAACAMAGAPPPTREHVQAYLAHARRGAQQSADWVAGLVLWMVRSKQFDAQRLARRDPVQLVPEAGRAWKMGDGQ